ncbi:hypothetical protein Dform_02057 [Dehalogenimonas formicexedens]|uniref:DUF1697 domain-containing protein n=1 Tax=Dehalogenimonas formicexedens TaxID=1839801 RepID=A0A1P8FA73_9CHLR|nr:DUF1697 domain-containing protein [Dehalogenimonas formicexedens]APV45366.1 hypothetical protein Dform_02057 [Dehalogenimonas formicexedens]
MVYVALLRGVNVGGKGLVSMTDLKAELNGLGFREVRTYIQSGNILFETNDDVATVRHKLEDLLKAKFKIDTLVIVKTREQLKQVAQNAPEAWHSRDDLRRYVAFISEPLDPGDVLPEVELKEGIDSVKEGPGVLYFSILLSGRTRSRLNRLMSKPVYRSISFRDFTTVQKLAEMIEQTGVRQALGD